MKHLEPEQQPITSQSLKKQKISSPASGWKLITIGVVLVASIGYAMNAAWNLAPVDRISDATKAELTAKFLALESVKLEPVAKQDIDTALNSMGLSPDQRRSLQETLTINNTEHNSQSKLSQPDNAALVWVNLWDSVSADGDIVTVSSAGYSVEILLQKAHARIAIPIDEATSEITITGVRDGGGGITLGVQSGYAPTILPVMRVGEVLSLPVSY